MNDLVFLKLQSFQDGIVSTDNVKEKHLTNKLVYSIISKDVKANSLTPRRNPWTLWK